MKVKEISRTANVAWSPQQQHPVCIAAGTAAQQLDATFSTSAALDLYSLDLSEPGLDMELAGSIQTDCRFHKLIWGSYGMSDGKNAAGTLVGGGDNGVVYIWSPKEIMSGGEGTLEKLTKHTGPVQALDINPYQTNLMASGASESDIYIWDLNNPSNPMTPGTKSQPPDDVTCLAWNRQVQHILSSTYAGRCVVWDLRKNEPIIKISDSMSRIKCKLVAWHPDVATQMCLASEDDHSPIIQLWDLRFATSPLKTLENHQRGILSMAWCPHDADLLLSCGKDNRILCWNPNTSVPNGEVVYELPTTNQWSFDVQWCPRNPALISGCSFDGNVSVYSIMGGAPAPKTPSKVADAFPSDPFSQPPQPSTTTETASVLKRPPKWMRRPVGASFAFGGKLVSFEQNKPANPQQPVQHFVRISQVVTETDLVSRSNQLEAALANGQFSEFCSLKIANSTSEEDEGIWNFLKVNFESEPRKRYLQLLGYDESDLAEKVAELTGQRESGSSALDADSLSDRVAELGVEAPAADAEGASAFEQIAQKQIEDRVSPLTISTDDDCEGLVTRALLTADFNAAVEVCLHNDRMAEAIILAVAGGPELLERTKRKFFKQNNSSLNRLISSVVTCEYEQLVKTCQLESWKEALAIALTYAKGDQFANLCDILGSRLETEQDGALANCACLCYICAGNIDKLVRCWNKSCVNSPLALMECVEKVMLLCKAVEQVKGVSPLAADAEALAGCLSQYAELLAAQGSMSTAITYLGDSQQQSLMLLRDRLYNALTTQEAANFSPPPKPFQVVPLTVSRQPAVKPAASSVPSSQQPQRGSYQAQAGSTFNTTTTSTSTYYATQTLAGQPNTGPYTSPYTSQASGVGAAGTGAAPATSSYLKGSVGQRYPTGQVYQQPTSTYEAYTSQPYVPPYSQPYSGASNSYMQPGVGVVSPPAVSSSQIYDPMTGASHHTPGGPSPYTNPASAASSVPTGTSYLDKRPDRAWNDPPLVQDKRKKAPSAYQAPAPITAPIMGVPVDQSPPGAPSYGQIYNPQDANMQPSQPPSYGYSQQPQTPAEPVEKPAPEPVKPVEKLPIPSEHQVLNEVLDKLTNQCLERATNAQMKRKLHDVLKKLEILYDRLRDQKLSAGVVQGLHQIVSAIQQFDYQTGLHYHTQMVSQGNFSEISSFMPGIKTLMQTALSLQVYVQ